MGTLKSPTQTPITLCHHLCLRNDSLQKVSKKKHFPFLMKQIHLQSIEMRNGAAEAAKVKINVSYLAFSAYFTFGFSVRRHKNITRKAFVVHICHLQMALAVNPHLLFTFSCYKRKKKDIYVYFNKESEYAGERKMFLAKHRGRPGNGESQSHNPG